MGFGQNSGPPASHTQLEELLELLQNEGYEDFRDARGPMGFTQRQAGGKFTRDEAQEFIQQLEEAEDARIEAEKTAPASAKPTGKPAAGPVAKAEEPASDPRLTDIPSDALAAELRRRGFEVSER